MTNPTVQYGSTGATVETLQERLNAWNVQPHVGITGTYGPVTLAAVQAFQMAKGVGLTGVVGPVTWTALEETIPAKPAAIKYNAVLDSTAALSGNLGWYNYPGVNESLNGEICYVGQDMWGDGDGQPGYTQETYAYSPGDWWTTVNFPAGNTAVVSYPNVQCTYYDVNSVDPLISSFKKIQSSWSVVMPSGAGLDGEATYDIWLNSWKTEIMIWVYDERTTTPLGNEIASYTNDGITYQVWGSAGNSGGYVDGTISFLPNKKLATGSVDLLAMFNWMISQKYVPATSGLTAIGFGFEMCSTGGVPMTFRTTNFTAYTD